jgi:hypothetical protein
MASMDDLVALRIAARRDRIALLEEDAKEKLRAMEEIQAAARQYRDAGDIESAKESSATATTCARC